MGLDQAEHNEQGYNILRKLSLLVRVALLAGLRHRA